MKDEIIVSPEIRYIISGRLVSVNLSENVVALKETKNSKKSGLVLFTGTQGEIIKTDLRPYSKIEELTGYPDFLDERVSNITDLFPRLSDSDLEEIERRTRYENFIGYRDAIQNIKTKEEHPVNVYWGQQEDPQEKFSGLSESYLVCLIRSHQFLPEEKEIKGIMEMNPKLYLNFEGYIRGFSQSVPFILGHTELKMEHMTSLEGQNTLSFELEKRFRKIAEELIAGEKEKREITTFYHKNGTPIEVDLYYKISEKQEYLGALIELVNPSQIKR